VHYPHLDNKSRMTWIKHRGDCTNETETRSTIKRKKRYLLILRILNEDKSTKTFAGYASGCKWTFPINGEWKSVSIRPMTSDCGLNESTNWNCHSMVCRKSYFKIAEPKRDRTWRWGLNIFYNVDVSCMCTPLTFHCSSHSHRVTNETAFHNEPV
jgi:hypothetical protein